MLKIKDNKDTRQIDKLPMRTTINWFPVLSSRHGSSDAKGHSEPDSRDTQETVVPQSLAGIMRVRALGPPRRDPSSRSACTNHSLHPAWLCMNEDQIEGPYTLGAWSAVTCIVGASQARERNEPIRHGEFFEDKGVWAGDHFG